MQFLPGKLGVPRRPIDPMRMQPRACSRRAKQPGSAGGANCVVCGKTASVFRRLKISTKAAASTVPLCPECDDQIAPLSAVSELLWFQTNGVDVLALVSAPLCKSGRR
jgi:hypothetical protein